MIEGHEVNIMVRVMTIRDGTHGISLTMPDKLLGEWTDSGAEALTVTDEFAVRILGCDGAHRYLLTMPGTPLSCQQLSATEACVVIRI